MQILPTAPLRKLRGLQILNVTNVDWTPIMKEAAALNRLLVLDSPGHIPAILEVVDGLPSLRYLRCNESLNRRNLFFLGQVDNKLQKRGGSVSFV